MYFASMLALEIKKGQDTEFIKYFNILPKNMNDCPMFFSEQEIAMLENTSIIGIYKDQKKEVEEYYNNRDN